MAKFTKYIIGAAVVVAGVVAAGLAMKWGADNDIPVLKDAANGFDQ